LYVIFDMLPMARPADVPLVWLFGEVKTPPFSAEARVEAGFLLRRLQQGEVLGLPYSRPMPTVGAGCHELRIPDRSVTWRIVYHVAGDAIVILDVFAKKTEATPQSVLATCRRRLAQYHTVTKARTGR
jgi:phage-related protein